MVINIIKFDCCVHNLYSIIICMGPWITLFWISNWIIFFLPWHLETVCWPPHNCPYWTLSERVILFCLFRRDCHSRLPGWSDWAIIVDKIFLMNKIVITTQHTLLIWKLGALVCCLGHVDQFIFLPNSKRLILSEIVYDHADHIIHWRMLPSKLTFDFWH